MTNTPYSNFYLSNEVEDQFNSHLDLMQFCKPDRTLTGTAGMTRKINIYKATDGTEKLAKGVGNTKSIEVSYTQREYKIQLAQNRFKYYDEDAMEDPMIVPVGVRYGATDMFNTVNGDVYGEIKKAKRVLLASKFDFAAFADAVSMFNLENLEGASIYALVHPKDMAAIRKAMGEDLKYVEAFAKNGYVGTVAGVNVYSKKDATPGAIYIAKRDALTAFIKKGTEVEQIAKNNRSEDAANTRENYIYTRKYYLVALTDERYDVKIMAGTATASTDTSASVSKTYYAADGAGYVAVTPGEGDNPKTKGWFEIA